MTTTYEIRTGYLRSILDTRRDRTGHASVTGALTALGRVDGGRAAKDYVTIEGAEGEHVYHSQEEADADRDGSRAIAVIAPEADAE